MDNQPLEGGARGGGGGSGRKGLLTDMSPKAALTALGSTVAAPTAFLVGSAIKRNKEIDENYEAAAKKREAAAEMKRESRGVEKSGTDKAREAAKVISDDEKYTKETPEQKYAKGGKVSSASSRADGCCVKGKTRGKMC